MLPIERARMHVKITSTEAQSDAFLFRLQAEHANEHSVNLKKKTAETVEAFLTIEKSMYRVIQDLLKKDRNRFAQVVVEILDAATFNAAVQH